MHSTWKTVLTTAAIAVLAVALSGNLPCAWAEEGHESHPGEARSSTFRLGAHRLWLFRSFLQDETDDATVLGIEFESYINIGSYQIKNIAYIELADYARAIPGQPPGTPATISGAATGLSDLLTAFLVSKRTAHHGKHHFAPGWAMQFPTASDETLGSGKWCIGPSFDYEYENGSLFAGAIALQLWSFAGDEDRKDVNMLMIKPFIVYGISERWDLIYMPYGISVYWDKPSGENVYFPLGGGAQYHIPAGSMEVNLALQFFRNVVRPTKGTVNDLRFLIELAF